MKEIKDPKTTKINEQKLASLEITDGSVEDNFFAIIEMRTANMALVPPLITEHIIITTSNNLCSERIKQNINFC